MVRVSSASWRRSLRTGQARWPALRGPLRPCRVLWWDGRNLRTSQLFFVRRLKLSPPLLKFNVAHVERLIGRSCEPIGDTPALLRVVNRQVDDLATRADGVGDPAER